MEEEREQGQMLQGGALKTEVRTRLSTLRETGGTWIFT